MDASDPLRHHPHVQNPDGHWYRRFAEIPGVGYEGDLRLRERLAARNITPEVTRDVFGGREAVSLMWPSRAGTTSASPVHQLTFGTTAEESSENLRERILSALELPGELSDYHFAIQGAAEALWKKRREEPQHIAFAEWLYWWDVRLIEAHPHVVQIRPGEPEYFGVHAFDRIVGLYEREGFLHEALAAAERFARFRPQLDTVSELRERVERLREEEHA